jgi:uncharacterized protein (DUF697 family)/GTP-binding protein EngB required for normal cell division
MSFNLTEEVRRAVEETLKKRGRANIVIAGRSGVGKSTLINAVFQGQMAETGQGRPVTKDVREITKGDIPLSIFDTRGLELDRYAETVKQLEDLVVSRQREIDPSRHIHVAWLCISEDSRRVEEGESSVARLLSSRVPLVVVITKARSDQGFRSKVEELVPEARNVARVRALHEVDDEGHELPPRGLKELVDVTMEILPEGHRNAMAAAQKVALDQKRTRAHAAVAAAATTAAGIGATPIPFSDALLLVPVQIGMLATITGIFGLSLTEGFLVTLLSGAVTAVGATVVGQQLASGLLKLLPGAGSVAGGAIAAATAAALTTTFGEAYVAVLHELFQKSGGEPPTLDAISKAFRDRLRRAASRKPAA